LAINQLIDECVVLFMENEETLLNGEFDCSLTNEIPSKEALVQIIEVSISKIYRCRSVLETESAGYKVLNGLLEIFVPATMASVNQSMSKKDQTYFRLLPDEAQVEITNAKNAYEAIRSVLDYVSGITDSNALNLYRIVTGISLPGRR
jgi:dGTPase